MTSELPRLPYYDYDADPAAFGARRLGEQRWRRAVWRVLAEECGARDGLLGMRDEFEQCFPACREFRFQGSLGFGGKVYSTAHEPYLWVSCYPEDRTPERDAAIDRANARLARLTERTME